MLYLTFSLLPPTSHPPLLLLPSPSLSDIFDLGSLPLHRLPSSYRLRLYLQSPGRQLRTQTSTRNPEEGAEDG